MQARTDSNTAQQASGQISCKLESPVPGPWRHICPFSACVTDGQRGPQMSTSKPGVIGHFSGGHPVCIEGSSTNNKRSDIILWSSVSLRSIFISKAGLSMTKYVDVPSLRLWNQRGLVQAVSRTDVRGKSCQ